MIKNNILIFALMILSFFMSLARAQAVQIPGNFADKEVILETVRHIGNAMQQPEQTFRATFGPMICNETDEIHVGNTRGYVKTGSRHGELKCQLPLGSTPKGTDPFFFPAYYRVCDARPQTEQQGRVCDARSLAEQQGVEKELFRISNNAITYDNQSGIRIQHRIEKNSFDTEFLIIEIEW